MIIVDRLKSKYNMAQPGKCYFYRDNTGNEVDLIEPEEHQVHGIEIKGGATISTDYFKGLSRFRNAFPEAFLDGTVIYAGDHSQQRTEWTVRSWRDVAAGDR